MNTLNSILAGLLMQLPPVPLPPGAYAAPPAMYQQQRPVLSREAWRRRILADAARFCDAYRDDVACQRPAP